tara:strand:+ start:332 stop:832 length:501 start_codon:yes stop_codon:yes gene_type:complete
MKKIEIKGKHNIDGFKENNERKHNWNYPKEVLDTKKQVNLLNQIYLDQDFKGKKDIKNEINKKINAYKQQDKKRNIYEKDKLITYLECLELLVLSKLKCYYCRCDMLLMYLDKRKENQWTLDRLNNNIGHHKNNVVICCLKCNLKKRRMDDEKFKFTKQLKIIKGF